MDPSPPPPGRMRMRSRAGYPHRRTLAAHLAQRLDWHDDASGRTIAAVLGQPLPRYSGPPPTRLAMASIPVGALPAAGG
jgi:hypothetical protein